MDLIEEHIDEIVLDLELRELSRVVNWILTGKDSCRVGLLNEGLDPLVEHICDGLQLLLLVGAHG